jgi:hypothetical protein
MSAFRTSRNKTGSGGHKTMPADNGNIFACLVHENKEGKEWPQV